MKYRLCLVAIAAAQLLIPARADDCPKLAIYARIPLTQIGGDPREFVPVEVAGVPKLMLLDTGAFFSTMSSKLADKLQLPSGAANFRLYGVTGAKSESFVSTSFELGGMRGNGIQFMLDPTGIGSGDDPRVVGLLGGSILTNYDLSIDFVANRLDLLSPNHCEGQVVYWPDRPITIIPFKLRDRSAIVLTVTLDGQEVTAQLDTGASTSTLERGKAERSFGLVVGSADTPVSGILNGVAGLTTWRHHFKSLSLAGVEVANLDVHIIPDKISEKVNTWSTGTLLDNRNNSVEVPSMLLGMDVLKQLHIYIAYKEKKLYITPSGQPTGSVPPAAAPAKAN